MNFNMAKTLSSRRHDGATPSRWPSEALRIILRELRQFRHATDAGVKSKGKALIKVVDVSFKYPRNDKVTIEKATVQVSLSSRVACIGPNGAGKSTLIKCLTGEVQPTTGTVWQHPNARIGYIAQHAFHHIEQRVFPSPVFALRLTTFMTLSTRCHLRDCVCSMAWTSTACTHTCIHV